MATATDLDARDSNSQAMDHLKMAIMEPLREASMVDPREEMVKVRNNNSLIGAMSNLNVVMLKEWHLRDLAMEVHNRTKPPSRPKLPSKVTLLI